MTLLARASERSALTTLFEDARVGMSGALVVYGDAGIGKTAVLDLGVDLATDFQVYRCSGVESEMEISFAALHQLCGSLEDQFGRLPEPQALAVSVALGLQSGTAPDPLLVGIAVLNLVANLAEERPLLWVVDDAHWLDRASAEVLAFVARRLMAESVVLLFAVRSSVGSQQLAGLRQIVVGGLSDADSRTLLAAAFPVRLDAQVRDRILAEANGNPLALLEMPRSASPAEFAGGFRVPEDSSVAVRIEQMFLARLSLQPNETQQLILLAAAEPLGDPHLLWRAAALLGLGSDAARAAESTELLRISARVTFRHPLVRSAVYWAATDDSRRAVHGALGEATDAALDPDRRAWHRAAASFEPNEEVAEELERSAERAHARGGIAAAAAFLQRASELTPDRARRATRALAAAHAQQLAGDPDAARALAAIAEAGPLDPLDLARLELLRARAALYLTFDRNAPRLFVEAAARLSTLDAALSLEAYLEAFEAATYAGRLGDQDGVKRAAEAAQAAPAVIGKPRAVDLLLDGLASRFAGGGASAIPTIRKALALFREEPDDQWLWTAMRTASDVWDFEIWEELSSRQVAAAREKGALTMLPIALNNRAGTQIFAGRFEAAQALIDEADTITDALGAARVPYATVFLAAWRGREHHTTAVLASILHDVQQRGEGHAVSFANWASAVQLNGLGRYDLALEASMTASEFDEPGWAVCALLEVVEAAARTDHFEIATHAFQRFAPVARASDTDWALGVEARSHALIEGGSATAEEFYEEAIERLTRAQVAVDIARAHLLFGEWLRRQRRRAEARQQLRSASDLFSTMGAEAFAERARVELLATGERVRRRSDEVRFQLTPQQTQIARLASEGHSNQEIASRLFISSRTVEYHLRNVFLALNITSRRELNGALI